MAERRPLKLVDLGSGQGEIRELAADDTLAAPGGIKGIRADDMPVGFLAMWPSSTLPTGWLKRNGAAISRTSYPALFALIGTTFGAGDGSTTFNLPDDRGLVERGWDDGRGHDTGRAFGSEQTDAVVSHTHNYSGIQGNSSGATVTNITTGSSWSITNNGHTTGTQTPAGATETRMKNRAYLPIIKALP